MARIVWRGKEVAAQMAAAAVVGVEATMAECVHEAAGGHPPYPPASRPYERYATRTGFAVGSLRSNGAEFDGRRAVGTWGDYANYALFLEIGTSISGPTATEREEAAGGNMDEIVPPIGPLMAPRPTLRPAADSERGYRMLAARIGAAFRGEALP